MLHKLSFVWPMKVSEDGPDESDPGPIMSSEDPPNYILVNRNIES